MALNLDACGSVVVVSEARCCVCSRRNHGNVYGCPKLKCRSCFWPAAWAGGLQHGPVACSMGPWPAAWPRGLKHGPVA